MTGQHPGRPDRPANARRAKKPRRGSFFGTLHGMQTGALAAVSTRRSKRPHAVTPVPNAAEIPHRPLFRCAVPRNGLAKQPKCAAPRMTGQHPDRPDRPANARRAKRPRRGSFFGTLHGMQTGALAAVSTRRVPFPKKPGSARTLLFSSTPAPCSVLFCRKVGPSCCHTPRGPVIC